MFLKCEFYYFSGMLKPIDQESIATNNYSFQEEGACHTTPGQGVRDGGIHSEALGQIWREKELGEMWAREFTAVSTGRTSEVG